MRNITLVAALAVAATLAAACSGGGVDTLLNGDGLGSAKGFAEGGSAAPGSGGGDDSGTPGSSHDGGISPGQDSGTAQPPPPSGADAGPPPPPAVNVFTGAPPFASTVAGDTHNAGQNCMGGCHNHGFTFAGTLTDGRGNGIAGAEVRLVDTNNVAISVYTGPNGNFHSSASFAAPAHVGARNATNTAIMVTALTGANGGCNGCHATGGTVAPIHLP